MDLLKTLFYLALNIARLAFYMAILHLLMPIEFIGGFILCFLKIYETPSWLKKTRRFLYGPYYEMYHYYE